MSSAALTGIAVLENPRVIPKSKTVVFDSQIYLGSMETSLIGTVRYFNSNNFEFSELGCYNVWIQLARMAPGIETYSQELTASDYHIMGDIIWMTPIGFPEGFEPRQQGFVQLCGVATNINRDDATFNVEAEPYVSAVKDVDGIKAIFPARCLILNTARFKKYKPIPANGRYVSVTGFLTNVELQEDHTVKQFVINIDQVIFLGQYVPTAPRAIEGGATTYKSESPARTKLKFNFGDSPATEPKNKKRRIGDHSKDKGEGTSKTPAS